MGVTKMRLRILEDGRPQYVIAADVGVSPARLSEYALGKRNVPSRLIYDFMRVFDCNPEEILGWDSDESIVGID